MKMLINIDELNNYKYNDKIPFQCEYCENNFYRMQKIVKYELKTLRQNNPFRFCSKECKHKAMFNGKTYCCSQCGLEIYRTPGYLIHKKRKSNRLFCNSRCAGLYNSQHRTFGYRRSKLEKWLEQELNKIYPNLKILYNDTLTILAELDIYFPTLKIAIELNGPLHYEPIFGLEKLTDTQKRDKRKILTCAENNIELVVINVSQFKYFKPEKAQVFLDMITNIVNSKLVLERGYDPLSY